MLDEFQAVANEIVLKTVADRRFDQHVLIQGLAGSGKSTLVETIAFILAQSGFSVYVTAHTNRATNNLKEALRQSNITVTTAGRLFGFTIDKYGHINLRNTKPKLKAGQIIFVDECSMLGNKVAKYMIEIADMCKCLLVMSGDSYQIPCIENGSFIKSPIFQNSRFNIVTLENCYRQEDKGDTSLYSLSNAIRNSIDGKKFPDIYSFDNVRSLNSRSFIAAAANRFKSGESVKVITLNGLAGVDGDLEGLNRHVKGKVLPASSSSAFQKGELLITNSDMVTDDGIFLTKDTDLNVVSVSKPKSSGIGIDINDYVCGSLFGGQSIKFSAALDIKGAIKKHIQLKSELMEADKAGNRIKSNELRKKINDFNRYAVPVNSAYAVSVFSAQGSQYDHVFLKLDNVAKNIDRQVLLRMLYVAVSRAQKSLTITGSLRLDIN